MSGIAMKRVSLQIHCGSFGEESFEYVGRSGNHEDLQQAAISPSETFKLWCYCSRR